MDLTHAAKLKAMGWKPPSFTPSVTFLAWCSVLAATMDQAKRDYMRARAEADAIKCRYCARDKLADPRFDDERHEIVHADGKRVRVPPIKWGMLTILRKRHGPVHREVLASLTDSECASAIAVHIWRLNQDLKGTGLYIEGRHGVGYILREGERPLVSVNMNGQPIRKRALPGEPGWPPSKEFTKAK